MNWSEKADNIILSSMIKIASCYITWKAYIMNAKKAVVEYLQSTHSVKKYISQFYNSNHAFPLLNSNDDTL